MKSNFEIIDGVTRADIAFRAYGGTLPELFISSALALMSIMVENPEGILFTLSKGIELSNVDRELLLFEFLNEFIFYKDSELLLLKPESVEIEKVNCEHRLQCNARGEYIDRNRHIFNVDIKAVTMHGLSIACDGGQWYAVVVLDV